MDHLPIITKLNLMMTLSQAAPFRNFHKVDWESFQDTLEAQFAALNLPNHLTTQKELNSACKSLTSAIQATIKAEVPITKIYSKSKCWWTKELTQLQQQTNRLGRLAYKHKDDPAHAIHMEHTEATKNYDQTLECTK